MADYHEHSDLAQLEEMQRLAPNDFAGFARLDSIVGRTDGAIPVKYRELLALAVAFTTQCPYCLDVHTAKAKAAGASREEVTEVALITALRAGAAVTHGTLALKLFDAAP